jgi:hypothetical protein
MNPNEQALQTQIDIDNSTITSAQGRVAANTAALTLLTEGYQSDQAAIAAAVVEQVGDIQTENATLTAQVADLTAQLATANGTITSMTAILAGLGYNPDGTPIS